MINSRSAPELPGFTAEIDQLLYTPELEAPSEAPHGFIYFITLRNESDRRLTVRFRKWIISCPAIGGLQVVEGEGVVGQTPTLEPGSDFTYNSRHFIRYDSEAAGSYFAVDDQGQMHACRLPLMSLEVPHWARES